MRGKIWAAGLAALLLASVPAALRAQISINAQVDRSQVALNGQITLTVDVSGASSSLPEPHIPSLPDFSVYSSGRSQSISIVNGKISSSIDYTYVLVPRFVGKGVIPPITLSDNGRTVRTSPIAIEVLRSAPAAEPPRTAPPPSAAQTQEVPGAPDFFVTAQLDKKKVYVDEQATLTVKFYNSAALAGNPQYTPPDLSGFMKEDLPPIRRESAQFRGRMYDVSVIKTAIFPERDGRLVIGPASVRCPVAGQGMDPFSPNFFNQVFNMNFGAAQMKTVSTNALKLAVLPLPTAGQPQNFSGAVGHFSISDSLDKSKTQVGGALNLTVTVKGQGNLRAMSDLQMPALANFRTYETVSSLNLDKKNDIVEGSKVYKTVLIPRVSGTLSIPPIAFAYFDPARGAYETIRTKPLSVGVKPGPANQAVGFASLGAASAPGLTEISQDIRYLNTNPERSPLASLLRRLGRGGPQNALPFIFFAACLLWRGAERRRLSDPKRLRARQACKTALALVAEASREAERDPKKSADLMSEALCGYLADKISEPPAGLTLRRAQELLRLRYPKLSAGTLSRIKNAWEELDLHRFAPAAHPGAGKTGAPDLAELLKAVEKELGA
ncbi:MAG TPA: BatD family protein [Elusimicrobiota bacterium]|nr:BatD family protein [Elusimicrobiota bacterium]